MKDRDMKRIAGAVKRSCEYLLEAGGRQYGGLWALAAVNTGPFTELWHLFLIV